MGADTFMTRSTGKTAADAFRNAVDEARHEHGNGGYSGTIAEKTGYANIAPPFARGDCASDKDFEKRCLEFADGLLNEGDKRIDDKWGPAGCIQLAPTVYVFFGWASS